MVGGLTLTLTALLAGLRKSTTAATPLMSSSTVTVVRLCQRTPATGTRAGITGIDGTVGIASSVASGTNLASCASGSPSGGASVGAASCTTRVSALKLGKGVPAGRNLGAYWTDGI